jgi:hypothetical protein
MRTSSALGCSIQNSSSMSARLGSQMTSPRMSWYPALALLYGFVGYGWPGWTLTNLVGVYFSGWYVISRFFDALITMQVGDDSRSLFWMDRWLNDCSILQLAPDLWNTVLPRTRKSCTIWGALLGRRWVRDIAFARIVYVVVQYLCMWDTLCDVHLPDQPARFICKWLSSG